MSFINKWIDKVDGVDDVLADDVNLLATGIKEAIEKAEETVTFDGIIETDEIDEYEFPQKSGSYVYKLIDSLIPDDFGGILLVASYYNKRGSITYLAKMYQTKIIVSTGEILTRQTTHTTHIQPITWSEWESVYATQKHVENTVAELAKIEDELERQKIINTVEGEAIALPDSSDAQLRGLKVMGKTEQFKTNGYQLFDAENMVFTNASRAEYKHMGNGVIRVTKTKANAGFTYVSGNMFDLEKVAGKKIYVSGYVKSSSVSSAKNTIRIGVGNSITQETKILANGETEATGTLNKISFSCNLASDLLENYDKVRIVLYENGTSNEVGNVGDYVDFSNIMISTVDVAYEPYTGGVPAPNVDYPQSLESVGDDGGVDVNVHGFQLFDASVIDSQESNGVTVTNNGDGSFTITGVATRGFSMIRNYDRKETLKLLRAGQISLSNNGVYGYPYVYMSLFGTNGKYFEVNTSSATYKTKTITQEMLDDESLTMRIGIYIKNNDTAVTYLKPMLYQDGDGTWEPFKPIQTLTIPTPNGLSGVPVSSGGNYTDESGQQRACDEVDFDREVYVQRVYELVATGNEKWSIVGSESNSYYNYRIMTSLPYSPKLTTNTSPHTYQKEACCSHLRSNTTVYTDAATDYGFIVAKQTLYIRTSLVQSNDITPWTDFCKQQYEAGTPVTFKYILATPIETPLSADEINAYKALQTYKPNTSIHNSDNAHMAVDYVADTKNYVDNQIKKEVAELTAAILTQ